MLAPTWCAGAIPIRTAFAVDCILQLCKGDGFCAFFVVEGEHQLVIIQENRVDKGVDHIADRQRTAVELALERVVCHAANDLLGKIGGIVFRIALQHGFKDDALCTFRYDFGCRHHLNGRSS